MGTSPVVGYSSVSPVNQCYDDKMQLAYGRTSFTAQAKAGFGPWIHNNYKYSIGQINLGSNPNTKLEIVSVLNLRNLATDSFFYNTENSAVKYNPKVYISAIQTASKNWIYDNNSGLKTEKKLAVGKVASNYAILLSKNT